MRRVVFATIRPHDRVSVVQYKEAAQRIDGLRAAEAMMRRRAATALVVTFLSVSAASAQSQSEAGLLRAQEAAAALTRGNAEQAIKLYGEALEDKGLSNDKRATIHTDRGVAYVKRGQYKAAIDDFNRAVVLYPEYAAIYNNRGNALLAVGQPREAIKDFDRAIVLAPGYAAAFSNRAAARVRLGDYDQALGDYAKAVELSPQSAASLNGRGRVHLLAGRPHAAARDFTRAISNDGRYSGAYRNRAESKLAVGQFEGAIEDLSRAIALDSKNVEAHIIRGKAYLAADNAASALKDFTRALELDPKSYAAFVARGYAHARIEAFDDALGDYVKAIEIDPKPVGAYAYRAWTYKQMQQPELGQKDVDRAVKLEPENADVLWARGEISEALGAIDAAIADYSKSIVLNPQMRESQAALDRLGARAIRTDVDVTAGGLEPWKIVRNGSLYVAVSERYPRLRVTLEMLGQGEPKLLEWDVRKAPFAGIGVLRYHAGALRAGQAAEDLENSAIVDLQSSSVVGVELHRLGAKTAKWTWEEGRLVVASADGITDEYLLRQGKPAGDSSVAAAAPVVKKQVSESSSIGSAPKKTSATPSWAPWAQQTDSRPAPVSAQRTKKPKTIFDMLFGN